MLISRILSRAPPSATSASLSSRLLPLGSSLYRHIATPSAAKQTDEQKAQHKARVARVQLRALPKSSIPERPLSAFILFAQDARKGVIDELGGPAAKPSFTQIGNAIGKKWKELDDRARQKYLEKASELRKDYDLKLAKYLENRSPLDLVVEQYRNKLFKALHPTKRITGKFADPNAPTHPLSAYGAFVKEMWGKSPDAQKEVVGKALKDGPVTDAALLMGEAWRKMSDADKQKYVSLGKKASEGYAVAKKKYEASLHDAREEVQTSMKDAVKKSRTLGRKKRTTAKKASSTKKKSDSTKKKTRPSSKKSAPLTKKASSTRGAKKTMGKKQKTTPKKRNVVKG